MLLTSTRADRLPKDYLLGSLIFSLADLTGHEGTRIDERTLAARLVGDLTLDGSGPLYLSPDGRRLVIAGSVTVLFDSEKQHFAIRRLVDGYSRGERFVASKLLEEAGLSATTFHRAFGSAKWKQLSPYLKSRDGLWGFEV